MRLWSLHPKYLDSKGLTALWREALLARAVLEGKTKGYRGHPQLARFKSSRDPLGLINRYLNAVHAESCARGFCFSAGKLKPAGGRAKLKVTLGQLSYELAHLRRKLERRDPEAALKLPRRKPAAHPLFTAVPGEAEAWEKVSE
jgi:hypothetical protein